MAITASIAITNTHKAVAVIHFTGDSSDALKLSLSDGSTKRMMAMLTRYKYCSIGWTVNTRKKKAQKSIQSQVNDKNVLH